MVKRHWRLCITTALLALLGGISALQHRAVFSHPTAGPTTISIVRASDWPVPDAEVETLVRQSVAMAGGLQGIIEPGDTVVIKPNLVWPASPDEGYTTDPRVVRAVIQLAQEAGAGQVLVAEGTACYRDGHDARGMTAEAFRICGFDVDGNMVDDATGVPLVDLNDAGGVDQHDPALVTLVEVPNGLIWSSYWLPRVVMEADVLIGVPVLKNHYLAGVTLALKNQIGIAPSDIYHSPGVQVLKGALGHGPNDLGRHIVDLNLARPLDFVVVDGLRGMTDGPNGGTLTTPRMGLVLAGADPVAADTVGALVMGYDPATIPYLAWAAGVGLGTNDVAQITVRGLRVGQARRDFPVPYGDPPAQRADASPPAVRITAPQDGTVVGDQVTVRATASDDRAIAKVEFFAGEELQAVATGPPYQATLDLSGHIGEALPLRAVAYDRALNDAGDEATVTVLRAPAPGTTSFQTATITIPTYPYAGHLTSAHDHTYGMTYEVLDWNSYNASGPAAAPQDYTLLVLENDHLLVTLLPELGGRVYQMVYKATGHNQLYRNPVIKPTHWGPPQQGWWLAAGGIEWCLPVAEHGYEWGQPWSWSVITSTAGVTVTLRDTTATNRLRASVDLFLPADRGYLAISPNLENPTSSGIDYKYWVNAMLSPGPENRPTAELEFIFNADWMSVHSTGDWAFPCAWQDPGGPTCLFTWPVHAGRDFSRLGNWHEWLGFFEYPQAAADFIGVYDHSAGEGMARVFPSSVAPGTKGFAFGWWNPTDWHIWTDDGSGYVELHGGVAPTFWDTAFLDPAETLSWTEYWFPVSSIGTLSGATSEAALGVQESGGTFHVGVHSTAARAPGESTLYVWDRATCAELAHWELPAVDPGNPFLTSVSSGGRSLEEVAFVYVSASGDLLAGVNPTDCLPPHVRADPLPPWVETTSFTVTWSGEDVWSGIASYDVQYRDGYEGAWTDWQMGTTATSALFSGVHGHTYFFRARARDLGGIQGAYGDEEWGQAFTTVLTTPAPVLVTSRKSAVPWLFHPNQTIAYTVVISNTGSQSGSVALTDTPPPGLVLLTGTLMASTDPTPTYESGQIHWNGMVEEGLEVRVTYTLSPTAATPLGLPLTNTAEITGSVLGPVTRHETVVRAYVRWLPVVARTWEP